MRTCAASYSSVCTGSHVLIFFFFLKDPTTAAIYTLSLHDALPISSDAALARKIDAHVEGLIEVIVGNLKLTPSTTGGGRDRKSTRLNSSHQIISYAVFCLKKKKTTSYINVSTTRAIRRVLSPSPVH